MVRVLTRGLLCVLLTLPLARPLLAQSQTALQLQAANIGKHRAPASNPLQRPVTLDASSIRLGDALAEISAQADLGLIYGNDLVPVEQRIEVHFQATPAGLALRHVLLDTGLEYRVTANQQVVLVKRSATPLAPSLSRAARTGSVVGKVTDAATGEPVAAADVWLDGTNKRTITTAEGRFLLTGVEPGTYNLRIRRIGYVAASQAVTIQAGQSVTANFALQNAPTQLDAIVATVTGEQRIRELGHVVGRINADSLVREAPISTLSQLLTARVPGLQIFQTSGTIGGEVAMRVRSASSLELTPEPIIIVDGVRYTGVSPYGTTATEGSSAAGPFNVEPTSRLNDINPNDIESIEVVKGPSAATLYGTDAANGVIVITTKRGRPGPARWNAYVRGGYNEVPNYKHPESYWGWPRSGTATCTLRNRSRGTCVQDSVTVVPSPLNDPEKTIFGPKPSWQYGTSVAGGQEQFRYFFSADFEEATGPLRLPPVMVDQLKERLGGGQPPESQLEPNKQEKVNLRANITANLSDRAVARMNVGFTHNTTRQMSLVNPFNLILNDLKPGQDAYDYPIDSFARSSEETVTRFSGSASLDWRPLEWLSTRATLGMDMPNSFRFSLAKRDAWANYTGTVDEDRNRALTTSGDLGATLSFRSAGGRISSRTSVGVQYVRAYGNRVTARGTDLRPGGGSIKDAATYTANQYYNESVTLGSYLEEVVGIDDRLFLTAAVRADGASTFGNDYQAALYPKAGISWVISEEPFMPRVPGLDEFRLRYAFGASGQQPRNDMQRYTFSTGQAVLDGVTVTRTYVSQLPSVGLRPERVREHEFGMDMSALDSRVRLDLTWNYRQITDQIRSVTLPGGFGTNWANVGYSTGNGFEAMLKARIIDNPLASWDLSVTHATNDTKVIDLGGVPPDYTYFGGMVEGFPLGARFMRKLLSYEDANQNGIIEETEIVMSDTAVYFGRGTPAWSQTFGTAVGLFQQRVRISALFDRHGDFTQYNLLTIRHRNSGLMRAAVDPTAPLADQARVMATWAGSAPGQGGATAYTFIEPGDYSRLREVTLSLTAPDGLARAAHVRNMMLSISARNLGLWTKAYNGDPESARFRGNFGGYADNVPQARNWVVRMDVGF